MLNNRPYSDPEGLRLQSSSQAHQGRTAPCEGLEKTYLGLMDKLESLAREGLGGSVYTQTTDVELEINGLMTYDRKVLKFDPAVLREAHRKVIEQV